MIRAPAAAARGWGSRSSSVRRRHTAAASSLCRARRAASSRASRYRPGSRMAKAAAYAIAPPIEPMLAKLADEVPAGDYLYEPKWDGFRAIVFHGGSELFIQSRDSRPLDRYFPELHDGLLEALPKGCVLDGEIVIATSHGLDFDALQLRLHPAASRVAKLANETPSSFVAFDALAVNGRDLTAETQAERRAALEKLLAKPKRPVYLTPMTRERDQALHWLEHFE